MNEYLIYSIIALGGAALRHYFPQLGKYLPGGQPPPLPTDPISPVNPSLPAPPMADRPLLDCLAWCQAAKVGAVRVDELDLRTLQSLRPFIDDLAGPLPPTPTK